MSEQNLRQEFEKSEHCEDLDFAWNDEFNCYADSTTQWIFQFWRDGWQACAERKNAEIDRLEAIIKSEANIIEQQAAEIAALRGFAMDLTIDCPYEFISSVDVYDAAKKHNLIDKHANPTPLLTGETE